MDEARRDFGQRHEDEAPLGQPRMRDDQCIRMQNDAGHEQNINVDCPGIVAGPGPALPGPFDRLGQGQ